MVSWKKGGVAWAILWCMSQAGANVVGEVQGVALQDQAQAPAGLLKLNGAAYAKKGFFKTHVMALYLNPPASSVPAVLAQPGPQRLVFTMLVSTSGETAARSSAADMEAMLSPAERAPMATAAAQLSRLYAAIDRIEKGDVFTLDWTPGKGLQAARNGQPLRAAGVPEHIDSELLWKSLLKLHLQHKGSTEFRENMLGMSRSMWSEANP